MIKAGSLFYTLIITLLIAIVTSSLILAAYYSRLQFQQLEMQEQLHANVQSGIELLLGEQDVIAPGETKETDLFGTGEDHVTLSRKFWGAYEIVISKAQFKSRGVLKIAQIGYYPDSTHNYSIYLPDHDKPLALCGKTVIRGTAYLPKAGIKRAYIEGQSFIGENLVNGTVKQSERILPEFDKVLTDKIKSIIENQQVSTSDSVIIIDGKLGGDSITNSFLNAPVVIKSVAEIQISGGLYKGNVAILSSKKIVVSATANIKDAILAAPQIIIESGFVGNLQAFATDSLIIKEGVHLNYPSVLGLLQQQESPVISAIILEKGAEVSGNVFSIKNEHNTRQECGVVVKQDAIITGQVHSNGFADIKGKINGSVMCNKFLLVTPSSVYENHLLNSIIDISRRSSHFAGINLVKESRAKKIVRWLN